MMVEEEPKKSEVFSFFRRIRIEPIFWILDGHSKFQPLWVMLSQPLWVMLSF